MNCLECHPREMSAVAICGRCGAGLCAEHLVESVEYLTFRLPINMQVPAAPPARKLRCERCTAAERGQQEHTAA